MSFRFRRKRSWIGCFLLPGFVACFAILLNNSIHVCGQEQMRTCAPPSSSNMYEWEALNYYEILDLPSRTKRANIASSDIRKAYRKQAQLYHPDKQKTSKNQTLTVEERNARFARIAEAYEILMDDEKRREYDAFLLDCEDHHLSQQQEPPDTQRSSSSMWSSIFDDLSSDPFKLFEEFFFGASSSSSGSSPWDEEIRYSRGNNNGRNRQGRNSNSNKYTTPIRVYETREVHHDPYTDRETLRVLQTEEFATDTNVGKIYYRVSAQDFIEEYDRFYGGWTYVPISQPFLVEEGYKQETRQQKEPSTNTLSPGEVLFPESTVLTSASGSFHAGLTRDCELLIVSDVRDEEFVVWSSETFVPSAQVHGGCFLQLQGPHLVLSLGTPNRPGQILWYNDVPDSVIQEEEENLVMGGAPSLFLARLDDDGSLAVYRHETSPPKTHPAGENDQVSWWRKLFMPRPVERPPQTRAARAWNHVQHWIRERIPHQQRSNVFPRETCIWSTSLAGCNTAGRAFFRVAHDVGHSVKHTMTKIDDAINSFVESIDEDEDLLDTIFRVANKATNGLLHAVQRILHMLQSSFTRLWHSSRKRH